MNNQRQPNVWISTNQILVNYLVVFFIFMVKISSFTKCNPCIFPLTNQKTLLAKDCLFAVWIYCNGFSCVWFFSVLWLLSGFRYSLYVISSKQCYSGRIQVFLCNHLASNKFLVLNKAYWPYGIKRLHNNSQQITKKKQTPTYTSNYSTINTV